MKSVREYLESHFTVSEEDWRYINLKLQLVEYNKNEVITEQGVIENNIYFIESGLLRLYYEGDNKDVTLNIGFPNTFLSSYSSFLTSSPSEFVLSSLTKSNLVAISKSDLEQIYMGTSCGNALGRLFSEQQFLYHSQRETAFMTLSPTQRYLDLFEHQPKLVKEIPLKYLASYIGITPQALSRIRAKIS